MELLFFSQLWVGFGIWSGKGEVPWINRRGWNALHLLCVCFRLPLLRCRSQGCLAVQGCCCCCFISSGVLTGGWLGVEAAQLLLENPWGSRRAVQCSHGLALCPWGTAGSPCIDGLDLTHFLLPYSGWFLQRPCRYLWKAFPTSLLLVEFANLEGGQSENNICWNT